MRLKVGIKEKNAPGASYANRTDCPICTPQLPSSHTCAVDFFLAAEACDLIASDRFWFGRKACPATMKRLGSKHLRRQIAPKWRVRQSAVARTIACRRPRRLT